MTHSRRTFMSRLGQGLFGLGLVAGGAGLAGLVGRAGQALAAGGAKRRFLFVVNQGGWDPLCALAPMFDNARVVMPVGATRATLGGIPFVDHAQRPAVRAFFAAHAARSVIVHGLSVRSVSHDICQVTMMTGASTGGAPDFATRLAVAGTDAALPHFVVSGPTYPGALASLVARGGRTGQLQELITGSLAERGDVAVTSASRPAARAIEDFVERRTAAFAAAAPGPAREALVTALGRAARLEDLQWDMSFASDGSFTSQLEIAVEALERGIAQCVTVSPPVSWDTHTNSDNQQSPLWEALFAGLGQVMDRLRDVVVVVVSEMGRTPQLNADQGRDHWPWTSALVVGDGLTGGRVVGGYDAGYAGRGIDPRTAEIDDQRAAPTPAVLGATLLALAGLDPGVLGPGATPLEGLLA